MAHRQPHPYVDDAHEYPIEMIRDSLKRVPVPHVPEGYILRQLRENEETEYNELFNLAWPSEGLFSDIWQSTLLGGFFVLEHEATRDLAASCIAGRPGVWDRHLDQSSLGWLVTDPAHGSRGLATIVATSVTNLLSEHAYQPVFLSTEDTRYPAIHIYLKLGWRPLIYREEMQQRWQSIYGHLGRPVADEFVYD